MGLLATAEVSGKHFSIVLAALVVIVGRRLRELIGNFSAINDSSTYFLSTTYILTYLFLFDFSVVEKFNSFKFNKSKEKTCKKIIFGLLI